jgi:hypothetical protein
LAPKIPNKDDVARRVEEASNPIVVRPLRMFNGTFCTRRYLFKLSIPSLRLAVSFLIMAHLDNNDIPAFYGVGASLSVT